MLNKMRKDIITARKSQETQFGIGPKNVSPMTIERNSMWHKIIPMTKRILTVLLNFFWRISESEINCSSSM